MATPRATRARSLSLMSLTDMVAWPAAAAAGMLVAENSIEIAISVLAKEDDGGNEGRFVEALARGGAVDPGGLG